ncbi:hypothetical protein SAMN04487764_2989 [Gillisia sp. Hel1_33_143]|uniref:pentapeptide repeat-containing protein n=1 Tax=Gillisia sp. Hel1_33_143 TaxID=1336796 RepID=UPI00087BCACE|nr:pentapeptide repeat-containing protein [Gillisia sp. Hel1_33_143]SDS76000.1 hypothetical protein SAMN04487764_2989 [Gillisia sp. Hel1_33_143]
MKKTVTNLNQLISNLQIRQIGRKASPEAENLIIDFDLTLPIDHSKITGLPHFDKNIFRFEKCEFNKRVTFTNNNYKLYFFDCDFYETSFEDVTFENKIRIQKSRFHRFLWLRNTTFKSLIDFWNTDFNEKVIFYKTDFESTVVFSAATFSENLLFTYSLLGKQAIFRGTTLKKGIDLSLAIHEGRLSIFDFHIADFETNNLELSKSDYEELVGEKGEIPIKNKRETFRIVKKAFENNSDYIHSLKYKKLELKTYRKILNQRISANEETWKSRTDKVILILNKFSNNYGTRFDVAILFTLTVGLIFYYLSFISSVEYGFSLCSDDWNSEIFRSFWSKFIRFLNPTHSDDYIGTDNNTFLFYVFDYLGRIAVGYGIYQTIQAFRKYK